MNIHDLVREDTQVASLPEIFFRLKETMDDPDCSFHDIGEVISHDAGLSVRLLKIVNSAFFGFPRKITTISHAASIIGLDQLSDMVISTLIMDKFKGIPSSVMNMRSFWEHNLACGLAARILASHKKEPNPEHFFVAGLLHDIGRLVLYMKVPAKVMESFQLSESEDLALHEAESKLMGFHHADVGGLLLKTWKLPKRHEEAVAFHHHPSAAPQHSFEAAMVHVADIVANTLQVGDSGETIIPRLERKARELTGVGESLFFSSIMKEVVKQFDEVSQAFLETTPK